MYSLSNDEFTIWINDDDDVALDGMGLIANKVRELRIMGGCFDGSVERDRWGKGEYNVEGDIPSAAEIFEKWPTPIVVTPWEVVLADGVIAEQGTHEELLASGGVYRELYETQFRMVLGGTAVCEDH